MTIEQAIYEIINASYEERIQAISAIADSLKQEQLPSVAKAKKIFKLTPIDLGSIDTPTRYEIYEQRNKQILGIDNE